MNFPTKKSGFLFMSKFVPSKLFSAVTCPNYRNTYSSYFKNMAVKWYQTFDSGEEMSLTVRLNQNCNTFKLGHNGDLPVPGIR